jgi:hypothetical protein
VFVRQLPLAIAFVFFLIHSKRIAVDFSLFHTKHIMDAQILKAPVQEHGSPLEVLEQQNRSIEHITETKGDLVNESHEDSCPVSLYTFWNLSTADTIY